MQSRQMEDKFMLRLPDGMRNTIKTFAARSGRSMNAEIILHLSKAYSGRAKALIEEARLVFGDRAADQLATIHGSAAGPQAGTGNPAADH